MKRKRHGPAKRSEVLDGSSTWVVGLDVSDQVLQLMDLRRVFFWASVLWPSPASCQRPPELLQCGPIVHVHVGAVLSEMA